MGKSMACLNIIACGKKDGVDGADLEAPEEKKICSDRRGWSFRKRSDRHRALNSTAGSETPSSVHKQSLETDVVDFQTKPELSVQEKTSIVQMDTNLSADFPKVDDSVDEADATIDELGVITMQASVRGFLARKLLWKQINNVIKLQAAVRGYLVRTQAIGTLRCVQAIIKIQALVRESSENDHHTPVNPNKKSLIMMEKLLSNAFARRVMESTPKPASIRIKCEPFKSDPAWKWLERWTLASSASSEGPEESEPVAEKLEYENLRHPVEEKGGHDLIQSGKNTSVNESEEDYDLISYEASRIEKDPIEDLTSNVVVIESSFNKSKGAADNELYVPDSERSSMEKPDETEILKTSCSRKASNPAFIAAQLKFEELSSSAKVSSTMISSCKEVGVKSRLDKVPSYTDLQVIGSECGTELSISSTLDSPERSVPVVNENELKPKDSDETKEEHLPTEEVIENPLLPEVDDSDKYEVANSSGVESAKQIPEADRIEPHDEVGSEMSHVACNNTTISESLSTPSSQVSVKPKKTGAGNKSKPKSSSSRDKKTLLDSASSKNSSDRENKAGKRRNSFELNISDLKEQEPRDSNSSGTNSLPSYMQATKSARAKAVSCGLHKSSPDKEAHDVRKRHSLPGGAHERQGSPRIQRSTSQAQQSPRDRKWRR